jgi:hypothetical protein
VIGLQQGVPGWLPTGRIRTFDIYRAVSVASGR